jgi:tetratricopeptide (TPR) repeat protein
MSNKTNPEEEVLVDVQQVYSKTENFIEANKKAVTIIPIAIFVLFGLYFGYKNYYIAPMEAEAQTQIFMAEKYFEQDSLQKAINGDGLNYGFIDIADEYSGTKTANLAHYYLGICYRNTGEYEMAIDELKSFSSDDVLISAIALGAIGDSYMELNDIDNATSYYKKAASKQANELTTPIYLFKAGLAFEENQDFNGAINQYEVIKADYPDSKEAQSIDKYIARAEAFVK